MTASVRSNHHALAWPIVAVAGASILFAACSTSSKASSSTSVAPPAASGSATTSGGSTASNASITVSATNVAGVGTVLVNGNGRTLYVLVSEKGGKVTCTAATGCTAIWPPLVVPSGMSQGIAGSGIQASLLGTVKSPAGDLRVTYGGWPLYTFTEDTASGTAKGQNFSDSFGIWLALSPSGNTVPAATSTGSSAPTTAAPQSGGAGF